MLQADSSEIPEQELQRFERYVRNYRFGDEIIKEGKEDDSSLYLLRKGSVGIYRNFNDEIKMVAKIDAVNFFGEMALVVGGSRTATVKVISNDAVVYKFQSPDLKSIYGNATWTELLVKRLCYDLKQSDDRIVSYDAEYTQLKQKYDGLFNYATELFTVLNELLEKTAVEIVQSTKVWHFLVDVRELMDAFIRERMPEVHDRMEGNREFILRRFKRDPTMRKNTRDLFERK
jgi:CRP-like cAMP-binding protein